MILMTTFRALRSLATPSRLPACDSRRMAGLPPLPAAMRTTPVPSEHEIAEAYHAHPYPHGRWEDRT